MEPNKYSPLPSSKAIPHVGNVLSEIFKTVYLNRAELARQLKQTQSTVFRYFQQESLQFKTLWNVSLVLNRNILAELGEKLPVEYISVREKALQNQVDTLQQELKTVNIELSVYKTITGK